MPKTITANRAIIRTVRLVLEAGQVTALEADADVNYGAFGQTETIDLWPNLTVVQQGHLQAIANKVAQRVQQIYLA